MLVKRYSTAKIAISKIDELRRRETPYRKMVEIACCAAILRAGQSLPLPKELNAGIVFSTSKGEVYPAVWRAMTLRNERVRPRQFESTTHNSAAGYSAIQLGLFGPQIVLVEGDGGFVARLQLVSGRSKFMLVCSAELEGPAECYALEARNDVL